MILLGYCAGYCKVQCSVVTCNFMCCSEGFLVLCCLVLCSAVPCSVGQYYSVQCSGQCRAVAGGRGEAAARDLTTADCY